MVYMVQSAAPSTRPFKCWNCRNHGPAAYTLVIGRTATEEGVYQTMPPASEDGANWVGRGLYCSDACLAAGLVREGTGGPLLRRYLREVHGRTGLGTIAMPHYVQKRYGGALGEADVKAGGMVCAPLLVEPPIDAIVSETLFSLLLAPAPV